VLTELVLVEKVVLPTIRAKMSIVGLVSTLNDGEFTTKVAEEEDPLGLPSVP
jgi:hypothetical protein